MDEQKALRELKRGNEKALCWFIDHYVGYVNTIIYNIIGSSMSSADLEEISSDVFFTLWRNAGKITQGKAKAYLGGVARNKARECLRKAGWELHLENDLILVSGEDPEKTLQERELARFLRRAVLAMQQPEREIFIRYYYYCQSVSLIAEEMRINLSTVKTKLHRGRKRLKEILSEGGYTVEDQNF
ncbi:MAG: sigma-70 family RNA polymerase sigma factor [Lachnospiraceae bacterium]|nr:sigma-70 family RNA polymerase sigma factor [Butyrivibrio sp.]MCM1342733.1 sigma-70 family RNA polymerase sigma factor [Muribaculaceae bacterium]MCM1410003.1 sigma-70 family RNA polymerase sigma factor [Lachnospiraceae bacterium]